MDHNQAEASKYLSEHLHGVWNCASAYANEVWVFLSDPHVMAVIIILFSCMLIAVYLKDRENAAKEAAAKKTVKEPK